MGATKSSPRTEADQIAAVADVRDCLVLSKTAPMASPIHIPGSSNEPFLKHGLGLLRAHALLVMLALGAFALVALLGGGVMAGWFGPSLPSDTLLVSGDIEAHESL